jgi:hypothetical protein
MIRSGLGTARATGVQALLAEILAEWRKAERLAAELPRGSPEQLAAQSASDRLHDLHRDVESAARLGVTDRGTFQQLFAELRLRERLDG